MITVKNVKNKVHNYIAKLAKSHIYHSTVYVFLNIHNNLLIKKVLDIDLYLKMELSLMVKRKTLKIQHRKGLNNARLIAINVLTNIKIIFVRNVFINLIDKRMGKIIFRKVKIRVMIVQSIQLDRVLKKWLILLNLMIPAVAVLKDVLLIAM